MKRILDPIFRYQPGYATDLRKTAALYLVLLILPGGSVFALIAWLCRRRSTIASRGA
jgi:hypothetical protein